MSENQTGAMVFVYFQKSVSCEVIRRVY